MYRVYLSPSICHKSTFCILYLKVVSLLQDSLKIKLQNCIPDFLYSFLFKSYTHKICTSRLPILGTNSTLPIFISKLNKMLRYSLVVTDVRRNQANWPMNKGAKSFEIMPPTVHSNFTVESKHPLHNKICQS